MNKLYNRRLNRGALVFGSRLLVSAALVFFCLAFSAHGSIDLLLVPAQMTERAASSMLLDAVNVNGRVVAVGERGHIVYSDDECKGWSQAVVPVSVTLTAVYFPTHMKGWAVGHDGIVLHTKDGGKTWEKQLDGYKINDLVLTQMNRVIRAKTEILEDENSGLTTAEKEALALELDNLDFVLGGDEIAVEEGPTRPLMDVWFKNDREGIVIGSFGIILSTDDGGQTWKPRLDTIENPEGYHFYSIIRSGEDLFMAGEAGLLYRSEDFGRTWQRLASPYEGSYFGITGDPAGGFVVAYGLRGNICYSLDRGETWHFSNNDNIASLTGGAFLSNGSLCVVGLDGVILKTADRGKTFTPLPKRIPGGIALVETKKGMLVVVGFRGATQIEVK